MRLISCLILILIGITFSRSKSLKPKIIGGRDAERDEFPYMISLRRTEIEAMQGISHICGGVIINETAILTAAHCLFDPFGNLLTQPLSYLVSGGFLGLYTDYPYDYRFATEIRIHPEFDPEQFINDIAVIQVEPKFNFSLPSFKPIKIDYNQDYNEGAQCSIHGWGLIDEMVLPDLLQTVDLKISNFSECSTTYVKYEAELNENSHFCAYEAEKDSCGGDSGSPVVINGNLVGLVSFGIGCAEENIPGVYTKVASFKSFIEGTNSSSNKIYHYDTMFGKFLGFLIAMFLRYKI